MKKYGFLFGSLALALAVVACQSKDDLTQLPIEDGEMVLSVEDTEVCSTGDSFLVAFTADSPWELKGRPDWLTVSQTSGKAGTVTIKITAQLNPTRKARVANLEFAARDGSFSTKMDVHQPFPYLDIQTDTLSFEWNDCRTERDGVVIDNNPQIIKLSTNVDWRIEEIATKADEPLIDVTHFSLSAMSGKDDYDLSVVPIRDNYDKVPYDTKLRLYPVYTDLDGIEHEIPAEAADSYILKLHQKNLRFLIDDSPADGEVEFNELDDEADINHTIDAELAWTIASKPNWVRLTPDHGQGIQTINFRADGPNPDTTAREGVIRLTTSPGAYREIHVRQEPYVYRFELDHGPIGPVPTDIQIQNQDETVYKMYLMTTGTWEVKNIPDWLVVEPSKWTETTAREPKVHEITVKAKGQNLNFHDNIATIQVASSMNSFSSDVPVNQKTFVFEVTPDAQLSDLPTMNTSKWNADIVITGRWEVVNTSDWITVSEMSSEGNKTVQINANNGNPDLSTDRTHTLKIVSLNHKDAGQDVYREIPVKQRKFTFEVTPTTNIHLAAYKKSFSTFYSLVKCSSDWALTSCPDWLQTTPEISGDGTKDVNIVFTPTANVQKSARDGDITVTSYYNGKTETYHVTQDAFVFDNDDVNYNDVAVMNTTPYQVKFDLTAEADWNLKEGYDAWLSPNKTSATATGSSQVQFTPQPNPLLTTRYGQAVVYCPVNNEEKTITFSQLPYQFNFDAEDFEYTELDTKSNTVTITSSGPWTISDAPSWVKLSAKSGNGSQTISVSLNNNVVTSPREATFNITTNLQGFQKPVRVAQTAYKFDDSQESFNYTTLEERADNFTVLSSGKWTATNIPNWVTLSKTSGNGSEAGVTENLTVTSKKNLTEQDRDATISIVSNDNANLVKNIVLHQDKFDFRVDQSSFTLSTPLDESTRTFAITCPAGWTVASDQIWLTPSVTSGTGDGSVVLTPVKNLTLDPRTAKVTVTSTLNDLKRTVTVNQPQFIFAVNKSEHTFTSPMMAENQPLQFRVDCTDNWTVSTTDGWLSLDKTAGAGTEFVNVTVNSTNINKTSRSGSVTVHSTLSGHDHVIAITQNPYVFDETAATLEVDPCSASILSKNLNITCSGLWTAVPNDAWLTVEQSVTTGNGQITVKADPNPYETPRVGTVTVKSLDNPALTRTVTVNQGAHTLVLDKTSMEFDPYPAGQQKTFSVTTHGPWTVSSDQPWCTLSQASANGNATITVTAGMNATAANRTATITVKCSNTSITKTLTVTQAPYVFNQDVKNVYLDACPVTGQSVEIVSSGAWSASASQSWVTLSTASGTGNATLTVSAKVNPSESSRSATVTITCADNTDWKKIVNVTQAGHVLTLSETNLAFGPVPAATQSFTITTTGPWKVTSSQSWLTVSPASGTGNGTVTVTAKTNNTKADRNATITVSCSSDESLYKQIAVTQEKYVFEIDETPLNLASCPANSTSFTVTSSGGWDVTSSQTWLTVSPASGNGNGSVTVTAAPNPNSTTRSAIVRVICKDNTNWNPYVTVTQAGHVLTLSQTSFAFGAKESGSASFNVTTSGPWTATSDASWVQITAGTGDGNGTVSFTYSQNLVLSSRSAVITVKCNDSARSEKVTVTQSAYQFSIAPTSLSTFTAMSPATQDITVTSLGDWTVTTSQAWIHPTKVGNVARIALDNNVNASTRSGSVTITNSDNPELKYTVTVSQAAYVFTVSPTTLSTFAATGAATKDVTVTCSGTWTVTKSHSWIQTTVISGGVRIGVQNNTATATRSGTVTITSNDNASLKQVITINQEAAPATE